MEIEKNIPMPNLEKKNAAKVCELLANANIGDSVEIEDDGSLVSASSYAAMNKIKVSRRKNPVTGKYRFWRIS